MDAQQILLKLRMCLLTRKANLSKSVRSVLYLRHSICRLLLRLECLFLFHLITDIIIKGMTTYIMEVPMKNSQHLKAYVQLHPDNKMAWYLLGKEYYKNGQEGKANYCFNQAGEVYEAFEHSKVPSEMLREYEEGLLESGRRRDQKRLKLRRILIGCMLILLLFVPTAAAPGLLLTKKLGEIPEAKEAVEVIIPEIQEEYAATETSSRGVGFQFTAREGGKGTSSGQALMDLLDNAKTPYIAVLGLERSGKWLLWREKLPLDYTLVKTSNGRAVYQSYDADTCDCQPPEHEELLKQAAVWQSKQEEAAVLWSSIRAFHNSKGRAPESLKELAGPFPGNWLAGTTPYMEEEFEQLQHTAIQASSKAGSEGAENSGSSEAEAVPPFMTEPLTIIVDKQQHRLAVISGSMILRNYEVGLGGDKTPEGGFVISDKVVNPNGHDNGEFGSRGLQLSDSNYAIHGTNDPESIGKDESLGCIRMSREDVEELFALVPMGTKVQISKGVLPEELLLPKERFSSATTQNQSNPRKVYRWLN